MSKIINNGPSSPPTSPGRPTSRSKRGKIIEIGQDRMATTVDATGCYVMPGGIDPHTHLEMPFMGTYSADHFESGTRAGLAGGTTMVVDFCLPCPDVAARGAADVGQQDLAPMPTIPSTWRSPGGTSASSTRWPWSRIAGINTFKHFMAYKGALMVNDDEMFRRSSAARNWAPCRLSMPRTATSWRTAAEAVAEGNNWPEAHAYSRPPEVEGEATNRAIMLADMAGVPLYVVHISCDRRMKRSAAPARRACGSLASRWSSTSPWTKPNISTRIGTMQPAAS